MKFATIDDPPYETNGSVIPVSGMIRRIPPTIVNVCSANPNVRPGREQLREAVVDPERHLHPARDEHHEDEQQRGDADEAELLGERRVDEVGLHVGDQRRVRRSW